MSSPKIFRIIGPTPQDNHFCLQLRRRDSRYVSKYTIYRIHLNGHYIIFGKEYSIDHLLRDYNGEVLGVEHKEEKANAKMLSKIREIAGEYLKKNTLSELIDLTQNTVEKPAQLDN